MALVRTLVANGSTRARSHVDIDNDVRLANLEAVLKVREVYRDWVDIQLVAFPQSGVVTEQGAPDLLAAALRAGADLVGGLDPAGFDGNARGQLDIVFGLAEKFEKRSTFICMMVGRPETPTGTVPEGLEPVYVHRQSRTLSEILVELLRASNKYIANQVFLEIGGRTA